MRPQFWNCPRSKNQIAQRAIDRGVPRRKRAHSSAVNRSQEQQMLKVVEMKNRSLGLLSVLAVAAVAVAGCGGGSGAGGVSAGGRNTGGYNNGDPGSRDNGSGADLSLASKSGLGKYLATSAGRTLYYFALDVPASG